MPQLQINNGGISSASSNRFLKFKAQCVVFPCGLLLMWHNATMSPTQMKEEVKMFGKEQEDGGVKGKELGISNNDDIFSCVG